MKHKRVLSVFLFISEHKILFGVLLLVLVLPGAWQLTNLYVDNSLESWFTEDSRELQDYRSFLEDFGNDETLAAVFHKDVELDLKALKEALGNIPQVDTVFSFKSNNHIMILMVMDNKSYDAKSRTAYITGAEEVFSRYFPGDEKVYFAGLGLLFDTLNRISAEDGTLLGGISYLIIILFLIFKLRDVRQVVISLLIVSLNLVVCLGIFGAAGKGINMVTMILPTLVITYSICDIVHFYHHVDIAHSKGHKAQALFSGIFSHIPIPCALTSITTAIGFLSLAVSPVPVVRDLGLFAAIFVMATYVITMLVFTTFFRFITARPDYNRRQKIRYPGRRTALPRWFGLLLLKKSAFILILSAVLFLVAGAGILKLEVDTYSIQFLKANHPVRMDSDAIEELYGNYVPLEILVDFGDGGMTDEALVELDRFVRQVKDDLLADNAFTVFNLYGTEKLPHTRRLAENLLKRISADKRKQWISAGNNRLRISFQIRMASARGFAKTIREIREQTDLTLKTAGYVPLYINMMQYISHTQLTSFLIAFASIFLIIFIISRSWKTGLAALGANLFPLTIVLGIMGWAGIRLDIATSTIAAVSLGIIVDDTIHFIFAYNRATERRVTGALDTAGRAIFSTSLILFAGFVVMAFAQVKSIALFGLFTALMILLACCGDLVILPAILNVLQKNVTEKGSIL